jgi:hypothetical protein
MTELMVPRTIETPAGKFVIYVGSAAQDPESHKPLRWYYAPEGWTGKPYSRDYYSAEAAQEGCWESLRESGSR